MPSYDPQRNRPRLRPKDDEPAAVDALLETAHDHHDHDHHDHDHHDHDHHDHDHHDHDHGDDDDGAPLDVALVPVVLVVGAVGGALLVWRAWRRRRAG
jgi:hypothetical protein